MRKAVSWLGVFLWAVLNSVAFAQPKSIPETSAPGFDTGMNASESAAALKGLLTSSEARGRWLRVRGLPLEGRAIALHREALRRLRRQGFRLCVNLEPSALAGLDFVRGGSGEAGALDLREVYLRCRWLAENFSNEVDAWEVGNEPDLNDPNRPDREAAFFKAASLGLQEGAKISRGILLHFEKQAGRSLVAHSPRRRPLILAAPTGLPPGPYFEKWWGDNEVAQYADAFSYHFYGYADDFGSVFGQYRAALASTANISAPGREKPLFVSEFGYGLLSPAAALTSEGRARQDAWFKNVGAQIEKIRPAAAMAFVLRPYTEANYNEFGLTDEAGRPSPAFRSLVSVKPPIHVPMHRLRPLDETSPVVIEVLPREALEIRSGYGGLIATGFSADPENVGYADVILYNFSHHALEGKLETAGEVGAELSSAPLTLPANGATRLILKVIVPARAFVEHSLVITFRPADRRVPVSRWASSFWPDMTGMEEKTVATFGESADASAENRNRLLQRTLAEGEPRLAEAGRWLVSKGVRIQESRTRWIFSIDHLPEEPLRPAIAELPFPDGFAFQKGDLLDFVYRELGESSGSTFDVQVRTANGNLYEVWPRLAFSATSRRFLQPAENFSMGFYGRAEVPWRFLENKPVALVFFFRPGSLPAKFEISRAAIIRLQATSDVLLQPSEPRERRAPTR